MYGLGFYSLRWKGFGVDGSGFRFWRFHFLLEGVYPGPETYTPIIPKYACICITPSVMPIRPFRSSMLACGRVGQPAWSREGKYPQH